MGFGILDDNKLPQVPGTVILDQEAAHSEGYTQHLKHAEGKNSHIILVPQPSDDPNDPLNWPGYQKLLCFGVLCLGSICWACVNVPSTHMRFTEIRELCSSLEQDKKQLIWM